jgi:cobalt-zinc-cadmium resistance protein CzcA
MRSGQSVGILREGERSFDVALRLGQPPVPDIEPLKRLRIPLAEGRVVMLGDVAELEVLEVPAQVSREQGRRRITVEANVRGRDLGGFVSELQSRIARLKLPTGYFVEYGGQFENLTRAAERLTVVVPLTLAAIIVMLYLTFGRLRPALLIFINVPVAAVGGVLALTIRGLDMSITAAVGFLALFGIAVLNGVVLIAVIQQHEKAGEERVEAVVRACSQRLRAILTTALVAALGFIPMAMATGVGAEVQRPLATVVIGGLITSTFATLFALPTLYIRFAARRVAGVAEADDQV